MESSTTSIVSALGAGSGVDMAALARNLADAQYQTRLDQLGLKSEVLDAKITAASTLKNQVLQLASAFGERVRNGDLAPSPVISAPSVASVSRSGSAAPAGSYTLEVLALASAQTLVGPAVPDAGAPVGAGTLTLRFGEVAPGTFTPDAARAPIAIDIPSGSTLSDIAAAINGSGAAVSAYVANSVDGAQLVLKGAEGVANGFVLEATEVPGEEGLAALTWEPVGGDAGRLLAQSDDARFDLDGIEMTSPTNKAGEVAPGISLTLTATNIGNPARIGFSDPSEAIGSVMSDLTSALNEIVAAVSAALDPQTGELARDDGARALRRSLSSLGSTVIMPNAADGAPATLAELGLAIGRDGTFSFSDATLNKALARDPEAVAAMFTNGLYGVYSTIDRISRTAATAGNPGSLAGSVSRYTSQQARVSEENSRIAEKQEVLRARLTKQFVAADTRIGISQSTLSFLEAQIALWNKRD